MKESDRTARSFEHHPRIGKKQKCWQSVKSIFFVLHNFVHYDCRAKQSRQERRSLRVIHRPSDTPPLTFTDPESKPSHPWAAAHPLDTPAEPNHRSLPLSHEASSWHCHGRWLHQNFPECPEVDWGPNAAAITCQAPTNNTSPIILWPKLRHSLLLGLDHQRHCPHRISKLQSVRRLRTPMMPRLCPRTAS